MWPKSKKNKSGYYLSCYSKLLLPDAWYRHKKELVYSKLSRFNEHEIMDRADFYFKQDIPFNVSVGAKDLSTFKKTFLGSFWLSNASCPTKYNQ